MSIKTIPLTSGRNLFLSSTLVMGVLNLTPDSFSDGGSYKNADAAVDRALEMERQGADIIDIGGESTRPGAKMVPAAEEIERVVPVIKALRASSTIPISIDTYKATTAKAALDAGADIVNDISALRFDPDLAQVVSAGKVPLIMMHMLGTPATMQNSPHYDDCVGELMDFFSERLAFCEKQGIDTGKVILDPGIGFGKRLEDNLYILSELARFKKLDKPLLVGTSRKSFIKMVHPTDKPARERIGGSIASMIMAVMNGADIVRVHDVAETVEALKVLRAIREGI
ncbi:MAG: dihydropteroate synthase [Candidatus Zixiibacteriota bacterium]